MTNSSDQTFEERLTQAERALERSERLAVASRYAAAIMHEVNNPLEAITNLVYLTKLHNHNPVQVLENMLVIERQLQTLGRVTSQALTFHRDLSDPKELDLVEVVEAALRLHADKLTRHGVIVNRQFRGPAPTWIIGNEILQVLSNLILNAMDALPRGKGKLTIRVRVMAPMAHITVSDNGTGIPDQFASRLFEPYVTSKVSGTGIGLWLSHRIITKHHGKLRFRTSRREDRSGTSFRVSLPTHQAA